MKVILLTTLIGVTAVMAAEKPAANGRPEPEAAHQMGDAKKETLLEAGRQVSGGGSAGDFGGSPFQPQLSPFDAGYGGGNNFQQRARAARQQAPFGRQANAMPAPSFGNDLDSFSGAFPQNRAARQAVQAFGGMPYGMPQYNPNFARGRMARQEMMPQMLPQMGPGMGGPMYNYPNFGAYGQYARGG